MNEIELLKQQIASENQKIDLCAVVLEVLQRRFGKEFTNKYADYTDTELLSVASENWAGLTPEQINQGLKLARSEEFCPSMPRFRKLCEKGSWLSENAAWIQALNHLRNPARPITLLAKKALLEVRDLIPNASDVDQAAKQIESAGFSFREVYKDLLLEAQNKGENQVFWQRPSTQEKDNKRNALGYTAPAEPTILDRLSEEHKFLVTEQRRMMDEGMSPRAALLEAQKMAGKRKLNKIDEKKAKSFTPMQQLINRGESPAEAFRLSTNGGAR